MIVWKIQIAPSVYEQIGLERTTYASKEAAINALIKAFGQHAMKFKIADGGDRVAFLNKDGGELAVVAPG